MADKGKVVIFPDVGSVEIEAAEWIARLEDQDASAENQVQFQDWLNASALNREVAARLMGVWSAFDPLTEASQPQGDVLAGSRDAATESRWKLPVSWRALAAAACVLIGVGAFLTYVLRPEPEPLQVLYETAVGGQKNIALPDGSSLLLNTNSKVKAVFSGKRRDVYLQRGEAYFEVVHDQDRPFTVYAGNRQIRDLGTAFDVLMQPQAVKVTVTRGTVEMAASAQNASPKRAASLGVVSAGHYAVFDRQLKSFGELSDTEVNRRLSWRNGILVYTGEPLAQVMADVSRYTKVKIEIPDPALQNLPIGGYFEVGKINLVYKALEKNFGIRAEWVDDSHVSLVSAATPQNAPISEK